MVENDPSLWWMSAGVREQFQRTADLAYCPALFMINKKGNTVRGGLSWRRFKKNEIKVLVWYRTVGTGVSSASM